MKAHFLLRTAIVALLLGHVGTPARAGVVFTFYEDEDPNRALAMIDLALPATALVDVNSITLTALGESSFSNPFTFNPTRAALLTTLTDAAGTLTGGGILETLSPPLDAQDHSWGNIYTFRPDGHASIKQIYNLGTNPLQTITFEGVWSSSPPTSSTQTPEPSSFILWGGAAMLAWGFRKRLKKG